MGNSRIPSSARHVAAVIVLICTIDAASAATPALVTSVEGGGQVAAANTAFPLPLTVRVTDADNAPVEGAAVRFTINHCQDGHVQCLRQEVYPYFTGHAYEVVVATDADGRAVSPAIGAGDIVLSGTDWVPAEVTATVDGAPDATPADFWLSGVVDLQTTPITPAFTGAWYDPNQSGHGIMLEVLSNDRLFAYWFAFDDAGGQAWFGGVGRIVGNEAVIYADQSLNGRWVPNFDPSLIHQQPWGTLAFTFSDCGHGEVYYAASTPGWGVGRMELTRLTVPAALSCP